MGNIYVVIDEDGAIAGCFRTINKKKLQTEIASNMNYYSVVITDKKVNADDNAFTARVCEEKEDDGSTEYIEKTYSITPSALA